MKLLKILLTLMLAYPGISLYAQVVNNATSLLDPNCPNCTPKERYRQEVAEMILFADQMNELDEKLSNLSPETLEFLRTIVSELPNDDSASTAFQLAVAKSERIIKEEEHDQLIEQLRAETELENARRAPLAPLPSNDSDPLGLLLTSNQAQEINEQNTVSRSSVPDSAGLYVNFVRPSTSEGGEAVIVLVDGEPRSLRIGGQFVYEDDTYRLSEINQVNRDDGRLYDVWVENTDTKRRQLLNWARSN